MRPLTYGVRWTAQAKSMLKAIGDRRIQEAILKRASMLAQEAEKQGNPLIGELLGFRSVRAVGQRYRIIYRVERHKVWVVVVAVGLRKEGSRADVYALAQKLFRQHLLVEE